MPPRIASFTGRADELDRLDAILMHDKPAAVTQVSVGRAAVQGMGGVGKTSLAIEYAHRFRGLYAGVCWCPAETRTGLLSALAGLAVTLGAATAEEADVEKAAKAALRRLAEQRATWLLVYDNVIAPDHIADLLPSAGARVLITSRFSDWSEMADEVALDVLPLEEAVALLQSRTGRSDAEGAKTLAEALGRLPLALDHAAAYCKRTQMSFTDYAAKASSLIDAAPRGAGYPRSIAATFNLAITEAVAQCPVAEALMAYLAQCAPERIPMILVAGAIEDEAERLQALAALVEVSLVKHDQFEDGTLAVTVHRLVQAVARARTERKGLVPNVVKKVTGRQIIRSPIRRLIARLVAIYPENSRENTSLWPLCDQLTPHLLAVSHSGLVHTAKRADLVNLLNRVGVYLTGRALYKQADKLLRDALAMSKSDILDTAVSLHNLGFLWQLQGDSLVARDLLERALAVCQGRVDPDNNPFIAMIGINLADVLMEQDDFEGARPLYVRGLNILETQIGPESPSTAMCLNKLGRLILRTDIDFEKARPLLERSHALYEKTLGSEHPDTIASLHNLASMYHEQGDLVRAHPIYERALALQNKVLGSAHPDTARMMHSFACVLHDQGELGNARQLYERALASTEAVLGPANPHTAQRLSGLASLLRDEGDLDGARQLIDRSIAICVQALGSEHRETCRSRDDLARVLMGQGDLTLAKTLFERTLATRQKAVGPWHRDIAPHLYNVATLLHKQDDLPRARQLYERSLAIFENALGPEHPNITKVLNGLGTLLRDQREIACALTYHQRALAICEKWRGPNHHWTAVCLGYVGVVLQDQGDLVGAVACRDRALAILEKTRVPEHFETATCLGCLGLVFQQQGEFSNAQSLFGRAVAIFIKVRGLEHSDTNRMRYRLSCLCLIMGNPLEACALGEAALAVHDKSLGRDHTWTKDSARVTADALDALGRAEDAKALRERYGVTPPENPHSS